MRFSMIFPVLVATLLFSGLALAAETQAAPPATIVLEDPLTAEDHNCYLPLVADQSTIRFQGKRMLPLLFSDRQLNLRNAINRIERQIESLEPRSVDTHTPGTREALGKFLGAYRQLEFFNRYRNASLKTKGRQAAIDAVVDEMVATYPEVPRADIVHSLETQFEQIVGALNAAVNHWRVKLSITDLGRAAGVTIGSSPDADFASIRLALAIPGRIEALRRLAVEFEEAANAAEVLASEISLAGDRDLAANTVNPPNADWWSRFEARRTHYANHLSDLKLQITALETRVSTLNRLLQQSRDAMVASWMAFTSDADPGNELGPALNALMNAENGSRNSADVTKLEGMIARTQAQISRSKALLARLTELQAQRLLIVVPGSK